MKYLPSYESDYKTSSTRSEILQKLQTKLEDPSFPFVGELQTDSFVLYEGGVLFSAWVGKACLSFVQLCAESLYGYPSTNITRIGFLKCYGSHVCI